MLGAFSPGPIIPNVGDITLVVDNAFQSSPELGAGRYISNTEGIIPAGALRIFTSRRSQNEINGPVTGLIPAFLVPGPFLIDSLETRSFR